MKLLAALLFALPLVACTEPTPEGPAENAAVPCDFDDARTACDDCEVSVLYDAAGVLKHVTATRPGLGLEQTYDAAGRMLASSQWDRSGLVAWGCYPEEGTVWFRLEAGKDGSGDTQCWNADGVEYPCNGKPPAWVALVDAAAMRPNR